MNGFTFFRNYYEAINDPENGLTEEEQGQIYNAVFAYMFEDKEPELKGACRMAFNLIKVSLDRSKRNGMNRSNAGEQSEPNGNGMEDEWKRNGSEMETVGDEKETIGSEMNDLSLRRKKKEDRDDTRQNAPAGAREGDEPEDGTVEAVVSAYTAFLSRHPDILVDITNPAFICDVDWELLDKKIGESRILKPKRSLNWLIGHYREIIGDSYKDFERSEASEKAEAAAKKRAKFYEEHPWMKEEEDGNG